MGFRKQPPAALALLLATSVPAHAATIVLTTNLSGANEVPPRATAGFGTATVTFDDVTNILDIQSSFAGLTGTTTMAHIHCCAGPGANGPVATTVPSFPGFPLGVTSGAFSETLDLTNPTSFNPAFITSSGGTVLGVRNALVAGLLGGQTYLNIHTTVFPGGEIRGQLLAAVPEPATWGMMLAGFGAIGYALRRRRVNVRVLAPE